MAVVSMTHPKSKQTIKVEPEQVGLYAGQGWSEKPAPKSTSK